MLCWGGFEPTKVGPGSMSQNDISRAVMLATGPWWDSWWMHQFYWSVQHVALKSRCTSSHMVEVGKPRSWTLCLSDGATTVSIYSYKIIFLIIVVIDLKESSENIWVISYIVFFYNLSWNLATVYYLYIYTNMIKNKEYTKISCTKCPVQNYKHS